MAVRRLAVLMLLAAVPCPGQAGRACVPGWSPPAPLVDSIGRPTYIEPGALLYTRGKILALSIPVLQWLETDRMLDTNKLAAIQSDSAISIRHFFQGGAWIDARGTTSLIPRPHLKVALTGPAAGLGRYAVVEAIYGVDSTGNGGTRLEYDRFDGNRWSTRTVILEGKFNWRPQTALVTRGDSVLFVAADADRQHPAFRLAMRAGGLWRDAAVPGTSLQRMYAVAAFNRRGQPVVVFNGDTAAGHDALFASTVLRWDSTATWSTPVAIDRDSTLFAYAMSIFPLGADSLVLTFERQRGYSGREAASLASMISTDGGASWKLSDSIPITSHGARFIKDSVGVIHAIYKANEASVLLSPGQVIHSMWRDGKWSKPMPAAKGQALTDPTIVATPDGIAALWSQAKEVVFRGRLEEQPHSYIAHWNRCR